MSTDQINEILSEGVLNLGNSVEMPCYVLNNGIRVLSGRGMQNALLNSDPDKKEEEKAGNELANFLTSKWFKELIISKYGLDNFKPIVCYKGGQKINGYEATTLADLCNIILQARLEGHVKTPKQKQIADQCEVLIRGFAKVGIIALVDEATGYQYERENAELQAIFKAYISKDLLPWQKRFPDNFYKEIFRLNGWNYTVKDIKQRPGVVGTWTKKLIYEQLPKGILKELEKNTPKNDEGKYKARLHQSLTSDIGNPHLQSQIYSIIGVMNISDDWKDFTRNFNKMVARKNGVVELPLNFEDLEYKGEPIIKDFDRNLKGLLNTPPPKK